MIIIEGISYMRLPIKTHRICVHDTIDAVIKKYAVPLLQKGDMLAVSERIVAIMQGRSFLISEIVPSWWARFLQRFVSRHPGGIGLKSPYTMQLAIEEVGLARVLCAAAVAAVTKPFGLKGLFYHIAGSNVNAIDGPCAYTLPPGNTSAKLGPSDPMGVARHIAGLTKAPTAVIDANDYGVRVLGYSDGINIKLVEKIFSDNPLGQSDGQTPLGIVRIKKITQSRPAYLGKNPMY